MHDKEKLSQEELNSESNSFNILENVTIESQKLNVTANDHSRNELTDVISTATQTIFIATNNSHNSIKNSTFGAEVLKNEAKK